MSKDDNETAELPTYVKIQDVTPYLLRDLTERTRRKALVDAGVVRQIGRRRWVALDLLQKELPEAHAAYVDAFFVSQLNH